MKRITFADVPASLLEYPMSGDIVFSGRTYRIVDIWRDPRTGIAITVVVDGPTGRTWLANPGCETGGKR